MDIQEILAQKTVRLATEYKLKNSILGTKEIDTQGRVIKAIVNTYDFFDSDGDVLVKGCANRSISDRGAKSQAVAKIAHLLHHNMRVPVGKSLLENEELLEGKRVLYVESYLPETADGEDTLTKYEVGIYNQHSIGFQYKDIEFIEKGSSTWGKAVSTLINPADAEEAGYMWIVKEIKWYEYSTVTFGANELTPYLGTKSKNKIDVAQAINLKLQVLAETAMRREIKDRSVFDLELSQLKQMVTELSAIEPIKPSTREGSQQLNIPTVIKLSGFSNSINF